MRLIALAKANPNQLRREDATYHEKLLLKRRLTGQRMMIRVAVVMINDMRSLASFFGRTAQEMIDRKLTGHLAVERDYRMLLPGKGRCMPWQRGGSPSTEVTRRQPERKVAMTLRRSFTTPGQGPAPRRWAGETNPVEPAATGEAIQDVVVATGRAQARGEDVPHAQGSGGPSTEAASPAELRSKASLKRERKREAKPEDEVKKARDKVTIKQYSSELRTVVNLFIKLPTGYYDSFKGV